MLELLKPKQHSVLFLFYPNPWTTYRERTRIGGNTHKFIAPQLLYSAIPELLLITIGSKRCPIGTIRSFNTRGIGPNSIFLKVCGLWGGKLWRICPPPQTSVFRPTDGKDNSFIGSTEFGFPVTFFANLFLERRALFNVLLCLLIRKL